MDNNEKNNDSLSEMSNLFGTNIKTPTTEEKPKDIPNINNEVPSKPLEEPTKEESKTEETQQKEEQTENIETPDENKQEEQKPEENKQEEFKPINEPVIKPTEEEHKFINEEYVNKDDNKPLVETPKSESKEDDGLISELIDTVEHFDFKEVKVNIALIGFAISLVGSILYNLIITIPGAALSYLAYKQAVEGKLSKQDKLLGILGMVLGVCCVLSLLITKVSSLFY